jgi:hypothetical protein
MKKYIALIAAFAAIAIAATAQVTQTSEAIDVRINDLDFKGEVIEQVNAVVADVADIASLVSVDTAANVDLLTKTPAFIGQVLVTPNATNTFTEVGVGATNTYVLRAAIAYGTTTNDWAKIATDK